MKFGATMSSIITIFPKHTELPYFVKAAELFAKVVSTYFSRGMMQRFQRTQFLAIGLGYENYPDLAYRAQKNPGEAEELLFFQDAEQNERIAQTFADNVDYIDFDTAIALLDVAAQCELKPYLQIPTLVRKTRISLGHKKFPEITVNKKPMNNLSKSQRAMQNFLSGGLRTLTTA